MSAHRVKACITPERIAWFAAYHAKHSGWGVFHVSLADGNWAFGARLENSQGEPGEDEAITWFNTLTQSQRRRLAGKC